MSKKDQLKLSVINDFIYRKITQIEAALELGTTERTMTRLANKVRREGIIGIKHGNTGKTPVNKTASDLLSKAVQEYEKNDGLVLKEIFVSGPILKAISFKWMVPSTDGIVRMNGA